jgi:hypothetical protein
VSTIHESIEKSSNVTPIEPAPKVRVGRRLQFDEHGHAIPLTDAEREDDRKALLLALEEMAAIPDDPPGSDEDFWRAIDAGRPERPLFQEFYKP